MAIYNTLKAANAARQKLWQNAEAPPSLSYWGNAIAGEVGEACNIIKKLERERLGMAGSRATLQDLADELADVKIYIALLEDELGLDGDAAVAHKFNRTSAKLGFDVQLRVPR